MASRVVVAAALLMAVLVAFAVAPACEGARVMREAGGAADQMVAKTTAAAAVATSNAGDVAAGKLSSYQPMRHKPPVPPSGPSHKHNKKVSQPKKAPLPPSGPSDNYHH